MKKKFYFLATTLMLFLAATTTQAATVKNEESFSKEAIANMTDGQKFMRVDEIQQRVNEIKDMDKSNLTKQERKQLRTELKSLKKEAQAMGGGGVYLSVGAIIIIILVLILIL
jgi:DNA gyrase/topoisomerase IV subunit A